MSSPERIPLSATSTTFFGSRLRQPKRRFRMHLKGSKIARIHSNQIASRIQSSLQLLFIVYLAQNIQLVRARGARQFFQLCLRQRRHNQQYRIRRIRPGLE